MKVVTQEINHREDKSWCDESIAMLGLASIRGVGYWTLRQIILSGQTFRRILSMAGTPEFELGLRKLGAKHLGAEDNTTNYSSDDLWQRGTASIEQLSKEGVQILHHEQPEFPQLLRSIADPPLWLFIKGATKSLHSKAIAVVGTRTPSDDGLFLARYVGSSSKYFAATIVSGLAHGIDQEVQTRCIRFGVPTVAVLGTGILLDYPSGTKNLRKQICEQGGALVTEYLPNQSYSAENFVRRNRLQAGLAQIVIPVEWRKSSGTAHTVRYANKERRQIICLRLPDWAKDRSELIYAKTLGAKLYTIPGEERQFFDAINVTLVAEEKLVSEQLTLWDSSAPGNRGAENE